MPIERTATETEPCSWPGCRTPLIEGSSRIIYETSDSKPYHAWHQDADE